MTRFSDEVLMAYADGALDEPERSAVEAAVRDDPEVRATVDAFQRTRDLAREAFAAPMSRSPPDALVQAILAPAPPTKAKPALKAIDGGRSDAAAAPAKVRPRPLFSGTQRPSMALAASVALAVGLALGALTSQWTSGGSDQVLTLGPVPTQSALAAVLERQSSGAASADRRWTVVATFRDRGGRACREVELLSQSGPQRPLQAGVACRMRDGGWTVEGAARIATALPSSGAIEPSGVAERDALDGLLNLLGASRALPPDEERALIEKGWR